MTRDELAIWITDLRGRLERGELAGLPPVTLPPWLTLTDVEAAVRLMLEAVDRCPRRALRGLPGPQHRASLSRETDGAPRTCSRPGRSHFPYDGDSLGGASNLLD
jgi:hypothetical protein